MKERKIEPAGAPRNSAGFSLVEMLVVLTILSLVISLAGPVLRRPQDSLRLEAAARTLASMMRLSRARAIARNADVVLMVDAGRRIFESSAVAAIQIDPEIAIELTFAAPEQRGHAAGAIRFFPDGTSSGGELVLTLGSRRARIAVNWITGEARLNLAADGPS
jgi:general secretion pathway protein H